MKWWRRREVWLGALSVVLITVLYNQLSAWLLPRPPQDLLTPAPAGSERGRALAADAVPDVRLDALTASRIKYDPRGRNLFQYGQKLPPPPPPPPPEEVVMQDLRRKQEEEEQRKRVEAIIAQKREEDARKQQEQQQMQPQTPPPPPQPSVAAAPEPDYKFVGYMGKASDKIAVMMHGDEVVLAKEGDRLGKDFVVREIEFDSVELGFTDPKFKDQKKLLPMGQ